MITYLSHTLSVCKVSIWHFICVRIAWNINHRAGEKEISGTKTISVTKTLILILTELQNWYLNRSYITSYIISSKTMSVTIRHGYVIKYLFKSCFHFFEFQDQEDVDNLIEQLSSKDWQERIQAIDSMVEMVENRLPLFTSNMVKVNKLESFTDW